MWRYSKLFYIGDTENPNESPYIPKKPSHSLTPRLIGCFTFIFTFILIFPFKQKISMNPGKLTRYKKNCRTSSVKPSRSVRHLLARNGELERGPDKRC